MWSCYLLNKIINPTLLFLPPFFMSWTQRSKIFFYVHKRPNSLKYCSQTCLNLCYRALLLCRDNSSTSQVWHIKIYFINLDCRNVHYSCCCKLNVHLSTISRLQMGFQRIWQYIQPVSQPQTTCNHTSPGPPHPASSPPRSSETSHPDSCWNNRFA